MSHPLYSLDLAQNVFFLFPSVKNKMSGQRFSTQCVTKVLRQLAQTHAKVCRSYWGIFWTTIKRFSMINICFCSLISKYKRQPSYKIIFSFFMPEFSIKRFVKTFKNCFFQKSLQFLAIFYEYSWPFNLKTFWISLQMRILILLL